MMNNSLSTLLLKGERKWISKIKESFLDAQLLAEYATWLLPLDNERGKFALELSKILISKQINASIYDLDVNPFWKEVLGANIIFAMIENDCASQVDQVKALFRPAFRLEPYTIEQPIEIGSSKLGGCPDLPINFQWPTGETCKAIFDESTAGEQRLAGFLGQVNFSELYIKDHPATIPSTGLLSFFCFQDIENDEPDKISVGAFYFESTKELQRVTPPSPLTEGNTLMDEQKLAFIETYDLPASYGSPWSNDYPFDPEEYYEFFDLIREQNFANLLGYARATTGDDPTLSKEHQHLIVLTNAHGCRLHMQIEKQDLAKKAFDKVILGWVDFD